MDLWIYLIQIQYRLQYVQVELHLQITKQIRWQFLPHLVIIYMIFANLHDICHSWWLSSHFDLFHCADWLTVYSLQSSSPSLCLKEPVKYHLNPQLLQTHCQCITLNLVYSSSLLYHNSLHYFQIGFWSKCNVKVNNIAIYVSAFVCSSC